jgi:hypothetical protein
MTYRLPGLVLDKHVVGFISLNLPSEIFWDEHLSFRGVNGNKPPHFAHSLNAYIN